MFWEDNARLIPDPDHSQDEDRKNPSASRLKRQVTIRLDVQTVEYFKQLAAEWGMPYQNLINLFLRDCAERKRRPTIRWPGVKKQTNE